MQQEKLHNQPWLPSWITNAVNWYIFERGPLKDYLVMYRVTSWLEPSLNWILILDILCYLMVGGQSKLVFDFIYIALPHGKKPV